MYSKSRQWSSGHSEEFQQQTSSNNRCHTCSVWQYSVQKWSRAIKRRSDKRALVQPKQFSRPRTLEPVVVPRTATPQFGSWCMQCASCGGQSIRGQNGLSSWKESYRLLNHYITAGHHSVNLSFSSSTLPLSTHVSSSSCVDWSLSSSVIHLILDVPNLTR